MSSIRVAFASCVLMVALAAGSWTAVHAFPLHAPMQAQAQPQTDPQGAPPRDPVSPEDFHKMAAAIQERVRQDAAMGAAEKIDLLKKGIAYEDRALERRPDFLSAIVYKGIMLRMQAALTSDPNEKAELVRQADAQRERAMKLSPPPPPPPPPPAAPSSSPAVEAAAIEFEQALASMKPLRIGGNMKAPTKIHDVKPVYPPDAMENKIQGVVIIEAIAGADGSIAAARVLRSIPAFDEVALNSVKQWKFTPTLLNGEPVPIVMTVTVNFTLK